MYSTCLLNLFQQRDEVHRLPNHLVQLCQGFDCAKLGGDLTRAPEAIAELLVGRNRLP